MQCIGNYQLTCLLGRGSSGEVFEAYNVLTKQKVAIKKVSIDDISIRLEIELMKKIHSKYIVEIYDVIQKDGYFFLIMEFAEGMTLLDYINTRPGPVEEYAAKRIIYQLLKCLDYLHNTEQIVHRDFKPENIMIDKELNIKVIDFGLSNQASNKSDKFTTACGSPFYAAPEIIRGEEYTYAVDIWSLGIVIYCLLYGVLPFYDENIKTLFKKILFANPSYYSYVSDEANDIIQKCLNKIPEKRVTLKELLENPWFGYQPTTLKQTKSTECFGQQPELYKKYCNTNPSVFKPMTDVKRRKFPISVIGNKRRTVQIKTLVLTRNTKLHA